MVKEKEMNTKKTDYTKPAAKPQTRKMKVGVVTAKKLNLRSSAEKGDNVIKILNKGEKVTIVREFPEWYRVKYDNGAVVGYVMKQFIELVEE